MNKVLFIILLVIESLIDLLCAGMMYSWGMIGVCAAIFGAMAILIVFLCLYIKKCREDENPDGVKRAHKRILLVMAMPLIPVIFVIFLIAVTLAIHG